eukprot:4266758-Prymnesium_polylepis.1
MPSRNGARSRPLLSVELNAAKPERKASGYRKTPFRRQRKSFLSLDGGFPVSELEEPNSYLEGPPGYYVEFSASKRARRHGTRTWHPRANDARAGSHAAITHKSRCPPGPWHPRGQPASLSTGDRLGAHEVPST